MRARVVGLTVVGLGGCALAVALLAGTWPTPSPEELALDESFETVATGEGSYLDPADLVPRTGAELSRSVRVSGDEDTGDADDDTVVWTAQTTTSDADGTLIDTGVTIACLDRRTAEAQPCAAESVDGEPVDVAGLTVAFPPDTQRRDHDVWDGAVRQALPARFAGTDEVRGLAVLRFEQEVPEQAVATVAVPGEWFGPAPDADADDDAAADDDEPAGDLSADVLHSGTRTLLVEPVSGVVVTAEESVLTVLRAPDGRAGPVLLSGTFRSTDATVADAVARARQALDRQDGMDDGLRWALGGTGLALVVLGALLAVRSRPATAQPGEDEPARVPVLTA
ncbi:porin PorA family protein [Trujillonella endophytica]|uniref:DUF3068 domain-containing protein n=1 Tax=Trujillonella endophytica TaxID=673521 RepID=A0A1H8PR98_9ACTN|nr:porin PorA family protein [Trujillella endophytica]SEO44204.1 Protein of unknown function [Trujillella endophytica]